MGPKLKPNQVEGSATLVDASINTEEVILASDKVRVTNEMGSQTEKAKKDEIVEIKSKQTENVGTDTEVIENKQIAMPAKNIEVDQIFKGNVRNNEQIVSFDPEMGMQLDSWLEYFNKKCCEYSKSDSWKVNNIQNYLKNSALTLYINSCLHLDSWYELSAILKEQFINVSVVSLSEFTSFKFSNNIELDQYFKAKLNMGRKLGLSRDMILEGLTDGLPANLKPMLTLQPPQDPTEWLRVATRLWKLQQNEVGSSKTAVQSTSQAEHKSNTAVPNVYRPPLEQRQWRPRPPQQNYTPPQNYRYRQPYQTYTPQNNYRPLPRVERPPRPTHNAHFQGRLPPSPCWVCEGQGIYNSYHWVQTCPLRSPVPDNIMTQLPENQSSSSQTQNKAIDSVSPRV